MQPLSPDARAAIAPYLLQHKVLWIAFSVVGVIYAIVGYVVASETVSEPMIESVIFSAAMYATSVVLAGVSFFVVQHCFSEQTLASKLSDPLDVQRLASINKQAANPERLALLQSLSQDELRLCHAVASLSASVIICAILLETMVLPGLLLAILMARPFAVVPFAIGAIIFSIALFPRPASLLAKIQRVQLQPPLY